MKYLTLFILSLPLFCNAAAPKRDVTFGNTWQDEELVAAPVPAGYEVHTFENGYVLIKNDGLFNIMAYKPGDFYSCSGGTLYKNGKSTGQSQTVDCTGPGTGFYLSCSGNRLTLVHAVAQACIEN